MKSHIAQYGRQFPSPIRISSFNSKFSSPVFGNLWLSSNIIPDFNRIAYIINLEINYYKEVPIFTGDWPNYKNQDSRTAIALRNKYCKILFPEQ